MYSGSTMKLINTSIHDLGSDNSTDFAMEQVVRESVAAAYDTICIIRIYSRKPRSKGTKGGASGGKWPTDPIADIDVIDPLELGDEGRGVTKPTVDEIVSAILDVIDKHSRACSSAMLYRIMFSDADDEKLDAIIVQPPGTPDDFKTVESETARLASEFTDIAGVFGRSLKEVHALYLDSMKETINLVKLHSESPLATAQVELLRAQMEWRRDEMEAEVSARRNERLLGILENVAPHIINNLNNMGSKDSSPQPDHPTEKEDSDMRSEVIECIDSISDDDMDNIKEFAPDLYDLIEASKSSENDADFRAVISEVSDRIRNDDKVRQSLVDCLPPEKLMEFLGLMKKWDI